MKTKPDHAIYDFSNAVYTLVLKDFEQVKEPLDKARFLFQCLIQINDLKMVDGQITLSDHTVRYVLSQAKYTFWLVEVPKPIDKFQFLDYLTKEITAIFYNLNPVDY